MFKRLMILGSMLLLPVLATAPVVQAEAPRTEADIAATITRKLAALPGPQLLAQAPAPAPAPAPAAPAKPDWSKRARGYKAAPPEVRAKLHAEAFKRHGHRMAHHVRAMTAPATWDSRTLGWIPPIRDQGQCHDMKTEVLTETGWQRWDEYDGISHLGTMNPETHQLEFQAPTRLIVRDHDGPMYYSARRSLDFAVTPGHRMYVRKWNERARTLDNEYQFVQMQDLGWYVGLPHATSGWRGVELDSLTVGGLTCSGDDFLALVALVISDGWTGGVEATKNRVSFCCFRDDRIDMVRHLAARLGFSEQPSRPGVWLRSDPVLAAWLKENCYDGTVYCSQFKRVPRIVKEASQRQIELFLQFFGDQHTEPDGVTRRFYSTNRLLVDDLQELLLRIGKRGTIGERGPRKTHFRKDGREIVSSLEGTLTERKTERLSIQRAKDIEVRHYTGKVYCATVPNGLLITRRNGSILISGNCGDCYGVSASDITTCAFIKAGMQKADGSFVISEQYGLDCGAYQGGCGGGDGPQVMDWMKSKGFPAEKYVDASGKNVSDYPGYTARPGNCRLTSAMKLWKPADWLFVTSDQSDRAPTVDEVKAGVMNYGAVSFSFDASNLDTVVTRLGNNIDHEVTGFVGWDDSKKMFLCRNQWGSSFGDGGYFWLAYSCLPQVQEPYAVVAAALPPPEPIPGPGPGPNPPVPGTAPVITSAATAAGSVGAAFRYQITASNSPTAFGANDLPKGLSISTATGVISGTPVAQGTSNITVFAANSTGTGTATLALTITVGPPGAVTISLTPDQVKSVISQSGAIVVTPGMTVEELMRAMAAAKSRTPVKDCGTCQRMTKLELRVADTESTLDRLTAALVKLLTPSKEPAAPPSKP